MKAIDQLQEQVQPLVAWLGTDHVYLQATLVFFIFILVAIVANILSSFILHRLMIKTKTRIDDQILSVFKRPLFISILLLGVSASMIVLKLEVSVLSFIQSVLITIGVVIWSVFLLRLTKIILRGFSAENAKYKIVSTQTLPLFENLAFLLSIVVALYLIFSVWDLDMTAWLASAGIVGIAVGFAAKDTLANLFSGVFILADAPYKIGDFIVLDSGERGEVTHIGIRSTRILTRDDVEVTVPNAIMGNTKIQNESGGRHEKFRIRVKVGIAYGSDIEKVRELLMQTAMDAGVVCVYPEPRVRFRAFGDSALMFQLLCWIDQPVLRGRVLDKLHSDIYVAFNEANIEIAYNKQDIYIKEMPGH